MKTMHTKMLRDRARHDAGGHQSDRGKSKNGFGEHIEQNVSKMLYKACENRVTTGR